MEIINGDILNVKEGIIVHQVNCIGVMGAGLASQIKHNYKQHYDDYINKYNLVVNKNDLLGKTVTSRINEKLYIVGIFAQLDVGTDKRYTDYGALEKGLDTLAWLRNKILEIDQHTKLNVYIPYGIGCGLGGGDWSVVEQILEKWKQKTMKYFKQSDFSYVKIVKYERGW